MNLNVTYLVGENRTLKLRLDEVEMKMRENEVKEFKAISELQEQVNILGKAYMNSNEVFTQIIEDLVGDDVDKLKKYGEFMMKRLNREHYLGFEEDEKIGE